MKTSSLYSSPAAKKAISDLYFEKLASLPMPYSEKTVATTYGDTHVVLAGDPANPPLVLLHGANAGAPIVLESMPGLTDSYCIYAIDMIGQPNLSAETRPSMKDLSYGLWLNEVLLGLGLSQVPVIGVSFGGFVGWKSALVHDSKVSQLFLLESAGIVNGNPFVGIFKIFWPLKRFIKTGKAQYLHRFLNTLFTEPDDFAVKYLSQVLRHMEMDLSPIPLISYQEAQSITIPVHVLGAELDNFFPGPAMLKRVKKIFPSLGKTLLLKGSKHVPGKEQDAQVVAFVKNALS